MSARTTVLHESPYYRVEQLPGTIVRVTRLPRPFESQEAVNVACNPVQEALTRIGRSKHCLLIDTRDAVGRNDPEYEKWFAYHRKAMIQGFVRVALLAKTVVGKMHVDRLLSTDKTQVITRVFYDERLALKYLSDE